ncbi:MAG: T9SS type A sorting domain-containing protein, partial [Bacteroidia bacterium]|nr:T9SS type A sorting domain-containing protein [Bacteroidia bacterium]
VSASPNQPTDACTGFVGPQPNHHNLRVTTVRGIESNPPCLLPAVCAVDVSACGGLNSCCNGSLANEILFAKSPAFSTAGHTNVRLEFSWHMNGGYWPPAQDIFVGSIPEALLAGEVYYSHDGTNWTLIQTPTLGGGGASQGQLRDQNTWYRARVSGAFLDNRPTLYLGFRHVIRNLHAPWTLLGLQSGQMNYSIVQGIINGDTASTPGLAIDDIVVYVPSGDGVALQCPQNFSAPVGQSFGLPITVTGATGAASVSWNINGATGSNSNVSAFPFLINHTFAQAGTYNYSVTVCADGQTRTCSGTITALSCAGDITITPVSLINPTGCDPNGAAYFEITPMLSDGQPYTLTLSPEGGTLVTGSGFSDLNAGTYYLTAIDPMGCTASYEFTLRPAEPVDSLGAAPAGCHTGGSITVKLKPCIEPPFVYRLVSGADTVAQIQSNETTAVFTDLAAGNYTVYIEYMGTGYTTGTITVAGAGNFGVIVENVTSPSNCAASDGVLTIRAVGGTPPYRLWLNGTEHSSFPGPTYPVGQLPAGIHTLYLTDAQECQSPPANATIPAPITFVVSVAATGETVGGASDGTITVSLDEGTMPNTDLTILLDGPYSAEVVVPVTTGPLPFTIGELPAGVYVVRVFDGNGCAAGGSPDTVEVLPGPVARHFLSDNRSFTVFPNPTSDKIELRFNGPVRARYEILDASGKSVLSGEFHSDKTEISLATLPKGTYYLQLFDGKSYAGTPVRLH